MDKTTLRKLILTYVEQNPTLNHSEVATLVLDENPLLKTSHRTVRRYVSAFREAALADQEDDDTSDLTSFVAPITDEFSPIREPSQDFMDSLEDDPVPPSNVQEDLKEQYKIVNGEYQLPHRGAFFILSVEKVDRVFCAYSRKGLNLSGPMVQSILKLSSEEFHSIVYHLGLNKESTPYAPYTAIRMDSSDLYSYLGDMVSYLMNIIHKADGTVSTQMVKEYKEAIVRQNNQELLFNTRFDEIKKLLPQVVVTPTRKLEGSTNMPGITHVIIPDMHIGIEQSNYNYDIIVSKLGEVLSFIDPLPRVHVSFMGDVIHSVSGLNHPDTWKNMSLDGHGANAIIRPYEILLNFLAAIPELERVNFVGGELIASN
jgi:hypothetical protein